MRTEEKGEKLSSKSFHLHISASNRILHLAPSLYTCLSNNEEHFTPNLSITYLFVVIQYVSLCVSLLCSQINEQFDGFAFEGELACQVTQDMHPRLVLYHCYEKVRRRMRTS